MGPNAPLRTSSAISPIRPFDLKKPGDSNGASRFLRLDNLSGQVFPLFAPFVTEPRAVATSFACCQTYKTIQEAGRYRSQFCNEWTQPPKLLPNRWDNLIKKLSP